MASTPSASSSTGTVEAAKMDVGDTILGSGSFSATDSETHQPLAGSPTTGTDSDSSSMSTPLLVGIIVASVIVFVAVLLVIRSRRRRYEPKLFSSSNASAFQRVNSTTAHENTTSDALGSSGVSTIVTSPQLPYMETFKLPRSSTKDASGDHVVVDIPEVHTTGNAAALPPMRGTQASRTTSLISGRSVFLASFLMRGGLRSSLPSLAAFRGSRSSEINQTNESQATGPIVTVPVAPAASAPPLPLDERHTDGDAWRDLSETCWSIGPGSDSETESERFSIAAGSYLPSGALVLRPRRLSTLSDDIADIDEDGVLHLEDLEVDSLDDSSRRRDRVMSFMDDWSPRRERGISMLDDSSPRRVRGLSALESRRKANSLADIVDTNKSGGSYFSVDSDYYDETIKDCSSVLFDDDSDSDSDSGDSLREEEF